MEIRKSTRTVPLAVGKTDADYYNSLKREYKEVDRVPGHKKEEAKHVLQNYNYLPFYIQTINAERQIEDGTQPFQDKNVLLPIPLAEKNANSAVASDISGEWN